MCAGANANANANGTEGYGTVGAKIKKVPTTGRGDSNSPKKTLASVRLGAAEDEGREGKGREGKGTKFFYKQTPVLTST